MNHHDSATVAINSSLSLGSESATHVARVLMVAAED